MTSKALPSYRLRWRFDYANRPSRYGLWNNPGGDHPSNKASFQNLEGLAWAVVEGQNLKTRETVRLAQVPGPDYRNMQWMAVGRMPGFPKGGSVTPFSNLVGLRIIGRDKEYEVYGSGQVVEKDISPAHQTIEFATYGK